MDAHLIIFGIVLYSLAIILGFLIRGNFKNIHLNRLLLYMLAVAMIGVLGEISVDTTYHYFAHTPLWRYNFVPVHYAYTSKFAPVLWSSAGLFLYLTHKKFDNWTKKDLLKLSIVFGLEAMLMEAIVDLISRPILGNYIYYYYPNGLWHISAFQNFPFYFLCGVVIAQVFYRFKPQPKFFSLLCVWIIVVTVYFY